MSFTKWVEIFGNAPSMTEWRPEQYAKNITLIYPITIPFDGDALKLTFSNRYSSEGVTINKWSVLKGDEVLYVNDTAISMNAGAEYTTESFEAAFKKDEKISVRFYIKDFANMTSAVFTCGSLSGGECAEGDFVTEKPDINRVVATNWNYFLTDVSLKTSVDKHAIICFGDSITAQDWPDDMYRRFLDNTDNKTSIIRKAVSGTRLLRQYDCNKYRSYGIKGDIRFPHEVNVEGADTVLIQHGINDIIHPVGTDVNEFRPWSDLPTAEEMIAVLKMYIQIAREHKLKVYLGTLLPIEGWRTYADFREELRQAVNDWIRTTDECEGVVDFDRAVCDPANPKSFASGYDSGDHLHPSKKAYARMGEEAYNILK